jgi:ABC-type glycerol-3-phosphate transport system substrate-binding protein
VSYGRRLAVLLTVVTLFGTGLLLASCGGDDEASDTTTTETTTTETTTTAETTTDTTTMETTTNPPLDQNNVVTVVVENGVPKGGIVRRAVDVGDRVILVVRSDVSDEVHVHGYDLMRDVAPGKPVRLAFRAAIPGRFEVELEDRGVPIADITVTT